MRNTAYAGTFLVLCAGTLLAQHSNNGNGNDNSVVDPAKFWQAPTPADTYMKETLTVNGTAIKEANTTVAIKRTFTMFLDPVAERLHLGKDWAAQTRSRATQSGYLNTLQQGTTVLARMVRMGEMQAGFAPDGSALLYDLMINYGPGGGMAQQRDYKIAALYAAALPTHIIVTSDGDVGAYVETPGNGSIRAFWTSNKAGQTQYNYSVYDSGSPSAKSGMSRSITSTSSESLEPNTLTDKKRVVVPKTMMLCDSTQTCVSGG